MTKKEMKTAGYRMIVKEKNSHQDAFDSLRNQHASDPAMLAKELSKIPSTGKLKETAALRYIFIALLIIVILLRVLGLIVIGAEKGMNMPLIIGMVALGIVVPAIGIYGALTARSEIYPTIGILMIIGLVRSIGQGDLDGSPENLVVIGVLLVTIGLSFYIPYKLKTPYTISSASSTQTTAADVNSGIYTFEDTRAAEDGVLDNRL